MAVIEHRIGGEFTPGAATENRDPKSETGPVVTAGAEQLIEGLIAAGEQRGAKIIRDGRGSRWPAGTVASSSARS
jgi:hypothetical protein